MNDLNTLSFCELRQKEVVNVIDGRRLGRIIDLIFCAGCGGEVKGIVVPYARRLFFSRSQEVFVPMSCIRKIGEDVILVELILDGGPREHHKRRRKYDAFEDGRFATAQVQEHTEYDRKEEKQEGYEIRESERDAYKPHFNLHSTEKKKKEKEPPPQDGPRCDRKCEKCMLFDCAYRWKDL